MASERVGEQLRQTVLDGRERRPHRDIGGLDPLAHLAGGRVEAIGRTVQALVGRCTDLPHGDLDVGLQLVGGGHAELGKARLDRVLEP